MKGYIVCVYKSINDQKALKDYAVKARVAVEKYDGKFLVRGGKKITTEGEEWQGDIGYGVLCRRSLAWRIFGPCRCRHAGHRRRRAPAATSRRQHAGRGSSRRGRNGGDSRY